MSLSYELIQKLPSEVAALYNAIRTVVEPEECQDPKATKDLQALLVFLDVQEDKVKKAISNMLSKPNVVRHLQGIPTISKEAEVDVKMILLQERVNQLTFEMEKLNRRGVEAETGEAVVSKKCISKTNPFLTCDC
nr:MAG: protein B [Henan forest noda-like virus 2]